MEHYLEEPFTKDKVKEYKAGDTVYITGTVYTARDAAHKRISEMMERGEKLPFDINNSIIYYVGPTPARPGKPIGSAGPTTSYRMDAYAPDFLDSGQLMMIGKGLISEKVLDAALSNGAVYCCAVGGAAALMAQSVKSSELIAFENLGAEAVRKLYVDKMPVKVVFDTDGENLYESGRKSYLEWNERGIL